MIKHTLKKSERLTSQLTIDKLFAGGNASMAVFPLRVVYMKMEEEKDVSNPSGADSLSGSAHFSIEPPVSILVSVPKKRFRHAAYRLNKHILWEAMEGKTYRLVIAFVCITDVLPTFPAVKKSVTKALVRISEKL